MEEVWVSSMEAGRMLGISGRTLRLYTQRGILPDVRSAGGRRVFRQQDIEALRVSRSGGARPADKVVAYARVSSGRQKDEGDLERQKARLAQHCGDRLVWVHTDVASGLSDRRPGLRRALRAAVTDPQVGTLLVTHRDRLARFGTGLIEYQLSLAGVQVAYLQDEAENHSPGAVPETSREMGEDLVAIVTSFAGKLYGARSARARRLRQAVTDHTLAAENGRGSDGDKA